MTLAVFLALVTTAVAGLLCVLAIAGLRRGQNGLARQYAKHSALLSAAFLPIISTGAFVSALSTTGPESKAYYLARGISEGMNVGALDIPIGLASFVVWIVARRRDIAAVR